VFVDVFRGDVLWSKEEREVSVVKLEWCEVEGLEVEVLELMRNCVEFFEC
jgi:hypothetical protein